MSSKSPTRAPYGGWPLAITILTILIRLLDGCDLQTMSFVVPAIVVDWGSSGCAPQPLLSSFFYSLGTIAIMVPASFFSLRTHIAPNRRRE